MLWAFRRKGNQPGLPRRAQGSFPEFRRLAHPKKIKQLAKMVEQYHFAEISLSMQTWTKRAVCGVAVNKVDRFPSGGIGAPQKYRCWCG
jgi:hypothetical protein